MTIRGFCSWLGAACLPRGIAVVECRGGITKYFFIVSHVRPPTVARSVLGATTRAVPLAAGNATRYMQSTFHDAYRRPAMGTFGWLAVYCGAILAVSLFGGSVPLLGRVTHSRLQLYLSLSAGVMLGACFFHVMPMPWRWPGPASAVDGPRRRWPLLRRAIPCPHSHEVLQQAPARARARTRLRARSRTPGGPCRGRLDGRGRPYHPYLHERRRPRGCRAFDDEKGPTATWALPGLALFLAIALHKPADALAISTVAVAQGCGPGQAGAGATGFRGHGPHRRQASSC